MFKAEEVAMLGPEERVQKQQVWRKLMHTRGGAGV